MKALMLALVLSVATGACKKSPSASRGGDSGQAGAGDANSTGGNTASTDQRLDSRAADTTSVTRPPDAAIKTGFAKCIEDWPTSGGSHPLKPSLEVEAPKLLWKTTVDGYTTGFYYEAGPVLSQNRLAFNAGNWVYFLNKDGTNPQTLYVEGCPSGLVADEQGNIYYTSDYAVVSLDTGGKPRWQLAINGFPAGSGPGDGCRPGLPPVLGPDGVLYATTYDNLVRAIRTSDGKALWSQPTQITSRVMGGGGKAVFVAYGDRRTDALDTRDGQSLGSFIDPVYGLSFVWQWGAWILGWDLQISCGNIMSFDTCGKWRWSGNPIGAGVIVPGELIAMLESEKGNALFLSDTKGNLVAGPVPAEGVPIAAGADGTIYTFRSQRGTIPAINRLLAYSADLKELWRIELTAESSFGIDGNVVLDNDGVLYVMRPLAGSDTEILAIQTRSPGLADSSWPSFRHDNRGTAWLVPGTDVTRTTSDASTTDAIDAPVGQGARH